MSEETDTMARYVEEGEYGPSVDYSAPCPHYDSQGNRISCTQAEHIDAARTVIEKDTQNRTKHTLWYVSAQVLTHRHNWDGSKQVPGFWVEASSEAEAHLKAFDIINTGFSYTHGEMASCTIQEVEASLLWKK